MAGNWVTIRPGDTLGAIARQAGVPLVRLERFNPGVQARNLRVGQRILVPSHRERAPGGGPYRYQVRPGDTYVGIARYFGTTAGRIDAANPGLHPSDLRVGQVVKVPLKGSAPRRTPPRVTHKKSTPARSLPDPGPIKQRQAWPWPLDDYRIVRRFGRDKRGTLQPMLLAARQGETAHAVADGDVRFANSMRQLGKVVIVHHAGNLQSVYALCGKLRVKEGQAVKQGSPICTVSHNDVTGRYDLLFDVRHGGKPINPDKVLR
ncbi:LysM peptidoglycan-binding domain-containing protein [Modicisalibacter tunisiensis]|nr:MAG: peptidase M23B [Halomonadaceae bacterium T82-2]MBZ9538206.1 LysM peptidoglycan-binding domain-containing protein [Modicisalibacter tunisiensis]